MTVDEVLKLKEAGFTGEEIAALGGVVDKPVASVQPGVSPIEAEKDVLKNIADGIAAMRESLDKMQQAAPALYKEEFGGLRKMLETNAINGISYEQRPEQIGNVDNILASIINPPVAEREAK